MTISASITQEPAPLNALVWVFGIAGGAALALALVTMALAANHKKRRVGGRYSPALSALVEYLNGVHESKKQEPVPQTAQLEKYKPPPADSTRALTTGDLVVDQAILQSVVQIASMLRRLYAQSASSSLDE